MYILYTCIFIFTSIKVRLLLTEHTENIYLSSCSITFGEPSTSVYVYYFFI